MFKYRLVDHAVPAMCREPGGGKVERRLPVRKRANDPGASPDLAEDALEWIVGSETAPMLLREGVAGERLLGCGVHKLGRLGVRAQREQLPEHSDSLCRGAATMSSTA